MAEQTTPLPLRGGIRPEVARRRIAAFRKHFGVAHLYLAQHAAFPLAVTPELLYHLWANFQRDVQGERLNIPWIAVADLLLSGLYNEVSHELFEMDITLREILLSDLKAHPNLGQQRIIELSHFLFRYIEQELESDDPHLRDVATTHRWVALSYTHPDDAARELARSLSKSVEENDTAEQMWMSSLIETFAEPLTGFAPLLTYARGVGYFAQGDIAQALTLFKRIDPNKKEHVAGVRLMLPIDVYSKEESFQQDQVVEEVAVLGSEVIPSSSYVPIWHVPYQRNPFFTGREDVLDQLHHALHTGTAVALSHPQGISGLGGIGKTQTALEYAYRYRSNYNAVFWVRADTIAALTSSMVDLARVLELPEHREQDPQIIVQAVLRWFRFHTGWLLIYDNVDDRVIEPFLPKAGPGHLLFTTRAHALAELADRLDIQKMEPEIGALLLLRRSGLLALQAPLETANPNDQRIAYAISQELDGLPLALDQAGAYIKEAPCPLPDYLTRYQTRRGDILRTRGGFDQGYPASVATTWSLSFEGVRQANPASADLLNFCAFLAPDAIPDAIITKGASHLPSLLQEVAANPIQLDGTMSMLFRYSLLHRNASTATLGIHRLVQTILRDDMTVEAAHQWKQRVILAVASASPDVEDVTQWDACEQWVPHALVCAAWIEQEKMLRVEAAHLLNTAGHYLNDRARYREAEPLLVRALSIHEQQLGTEHLDTALSLDNLAALYKNQGRYTEAESLVRQTLRIREWRLGSEHPDTAQSLNNLASLCLEEGKYAEAESLTIRALRIRERLLGSEHSSTAASLNTLADLYRRQGRYEEAEPLVKRALEIRERLLGAYHPDTTQSLNSLGLFYAAQGKYQEALSLIVRALEVRERLLGANHPDMAQSLNDLGLLYAIQGKQEEALPLIVRALEIRERLLGANHPDMAQSLYNLALLYATQGKYEEAKPVYQRAISIREQRLGTSHIRIKTELKDFFISYAHEDRQRAKWINQQLEEAGYSTILPSRDFLLGKNVMLEINIATQAKRTIAVLSPHYLASPFTQPEWIAALNQDPVGEQGLLLPVRVLPCEVEGLLASLIYIDLVDQEGEERARKVLLSGVEQTLKKLKPAEFPSLVISGQSSRVDPSLPSRYGSPFPEHWNVPRRHVPYFTGRDDLIQQMFQAFDAENAARIPEPQALLGLDGLGKTQTAAEYAYRYRGEYKAVLWVRADTKENLMTDFRSLIDLLHLPEEEDPIQTMHKWFIAQSGWLLILDNTEDPQIVDAFLPSTQRGHILLTTCVRAAANRVARLHLLEPLSPEGGALCILRRAGSVTSTGQLGDASSSRVNAATRLSELMDGLPLALEQAGAYIEDTGSSESRYLSIYEKRRAEIVRRQFGALPNYPLSVVTAWEFSKIVVQQKDPAAFELLQLCAFLAPDAIPEEIFTEGAVALGPVLGPKVANAFDSDTTTIILRRYSLLNREVKGEEESAQFSMHRMMQEILKDEMDEATKQLWAERAVRAVSLALPSVEEHIIQAHVRHCIPLIEQWSMTFPEAERLRQYAEETLNASDG